MQPCEGNGLSGASDRRNKAKVHRADATSYPKVQHDLGTK